jgi:hypothetical protein
MLKELGKGGVFSLSSDTNAGISTLTGFDNGGPFLILDVPLAANLLILAGALGFEQIILFDVVLFDALQVVETGLDRIGRLEGMFGRRRWQGNGRRQGTGKSILVSSTHRDIAVGRFHFHQIAIARGGRPLWWLLQSSQVWMIGGVP